MIDDPKPLCRALLGQTIDSLAAENRQLKAKADGACEQCRCDLYRRLKSLRAENERLRLVMGKTASMLETEESTPEKETGRLRAALAKGGDEP